jgi:acetyl esterase
MTYNFDSELSAMAAMFPYSELVDPDASRAEMAGIIAMMSANLDASGVVISDFEIDGLDGNQVPVRMYCPEGLSTTTAGLLHIHGGGFVLGDLDSEHSNNVSECRDLGIVIVSVDYRLSPEHPYPAGLNDCYATLCWLAQQSEALNVDPSRIAITGSSAGGCLSAALALMARDKKGPEICFQFLGIPAVDDRLNTPSMAQFIDTPMWHRANAVLSWDYYLGETYKRGSANVPYLAAPARCDDLSELPPAYVSTMEFDPLRDEGLLYAMRLLQAGVPTEIHSFPGTFHASNGLAPQAAISQRETSERRVVLRKALKIS